MMAIATQQICKFSIANSIKNRSSLDEDIVPTTYGSSSLIVKMVSETSAVREKNDVIPK